MAINRASRAKQSNTDTVGASDAPTLPDTPDASKSDEEPAQADPGVVIEDYEDEAAFEAPPPPPKREKIPDVYVLRANLRGADGKMKRPGQQVRLDKATAERLMREGLAVQATREVKPAR